jgi:AcrR family transcriptional regulator
VGTTDQKPRGGRLPRRERRVQLLDSALEVFVAQGYHAAAMDDIAERAGVSKPVLYQHFPGKLDLYLALLDQSCDTIVDNCRRALASTPDNKQRVAATMDVFYEYVAGDSGAFRLVFESDLTNEPAVREHVDRVTTECAAMIADVIHDDTGLPGDASRLLAVSLVGMAQVSARFWLTDPGGIGKSDAAALVAGLAWRGIRGYPRTDEH